MVLIEGGSFLMGSDDGADNERPIHRVRVDSFELKRCQVTNAEFAQFLDDTGHPQPLSRDDPGFNDPNQPVVAVSWFDALAYCDWLSIGASRRYRLPTEAEWEFAARGGAEGMRYPWGDAVPQRQVYNDARPGTGPEPVGQSQPNGYGLYDMCENVHEWCSDWYDAGYYAVSSERNPLGPETGVRRVSRGGSWRHQIRFTRCAARSSIPAEFRYTDYGFRVACDTQDRVIRSSFTRLHHLPVFLLAFLSDLQYIPVPRTFIPTGTRMNS